MPHQLAVATVAPVSLLETDAPDAEPDVTWGHGSIDDWGWTALESESFSEPAPEQP